VAVDSDRLRRSSRRETTRIVRGVVRVRGVCSGSHAALVAERRSVFLEARPFVAARSVPVLAPQGWAVP